MIRIIIKMIVLFIIFTVSYIYENRPVDSSSALNGPSRKKISRKFPWYTVEIETSPSGASVYIDGLPLGASPCISRQKSGNHVLSAFMGKRKSSLDFTLKEQCRLFLEMPGISISCEETAETLTVNASQTAEVYYDSIEALSAQAEHLFDSGSMEAGISSCLLILEKNKRHTMSLLNLGWAYSQTEDYDRAFYYSGKAIESDPENPEAWRIRGLANEETGEYLKAVRDYQKAIELGSQDHDLLFRLACCHEIAGNSLKSLEYLNEYLSRYPEDTDALLYRSYLFLNSGRVDDAVSDCQLILRNEPDEATALLNMGWALILKSCPEDALKYLDRSIELEPEHALAYNDRGIAWEDLEEYEKALNDYKTAHELDPDLEMAEANLKRMTDNLKK